MTTLATILIPLVDKAPDPADVKPGWLAFGIVVALALAVVFLGFSLRKHLNKVNFEERGTTGPVDPPAGPSSGPASDAERPPRS